MSAHPVFFTVSFRRKMAQLELSQRKEWLASLSMRVRDASASPTSMLGRELREVARGCRLALVESVEKQLGPFDPALSRALLEVPRERFVRAEDLARSADDTPLALDDEGLATISAPHAYLLTYRLLELKKGDRLVELGAGSGYGASLAAFVVGGTGSVLSFEIDPALVRRAKHALRADPSPVPGASDVTVVEGDAMTSAPHWGAAKKIAVTFAVESLPEAWTTALPEGGLLVAPVGSRDREQRLVRVTKRRGHVIETDHGPVRYVMNRSPR